MNGVEYAITGRESHVQMYVTEIVNLTIKEMKRMIFINAGLQKCWLGHPVKYAKTSRKRCTTAKFNNEETPCRRLFHRDGDFKIFRPFGCTALV